MSRVFIFPQKINFYIPTKITDILELENLRKNWLLTSSACGQIVMFLIAISINCSTTSMLFCAQWNVLVSKNRNVVGAWILFQIDTLLGCSQFPSRGSMITEIGLLNIVRQKRGINLFFFDYLSILKWRVFAIITISSRPKLTRVPCTRYFLAMCHS